MDHKNYRRCPHIIGGESQNIEMDRSVLIDNIGVKGRDIQTALQTIDSRGDHKTIYYMAKCEKFYGLIPMLRRFKRRLKLCLYVLQGKAGVYHYKEDEHSMNPDSIISDKYVHLPK